MNDIAVIPQQTGVFSSAQSFENAQRMANALSKASLVPKDYQNNLPNALIALEVAQRIGASPLLVMQNLYVVHGRPSWSSQFLIAACNQSGRFTALQYEFKGNEGSDDWGCRAYAKEKESDQIVYGPWVTIGMAKSEGWYDRKDKYGKQSSKWPSMPELMLTYRAAAFFVRTKAPEISMGMHTAEEVRDMGPAERVYESAPAASLDDELVAVAEVVDPESNPEPETETSAQSEQIRDGLLKTIESADSAETLSAIWEEIKTEFAQNMTAKDNAAVKSAYAAKYKGFKGK